MMFTSLLPLALLASALAAPVVDKSDVKNFYLLASPHKSTAAANATGLNLVDPYQQTNFLLRAQPTAASYSLFNLTSKGVLETMSLPPYEFTPARFESNLDASSGSVFFVQDKGTKGLFSFSTKGFLAYNNDYEHWTQCLGPLEQDVINYKGTDASCTKVYIFHQSTLPSSA